MTTLLAQIDAARAEPGARFAVITHARLVGDTEAALAHISARLELDPPLENRYTYSPHDAHKGVGDPIFAGGQTSIVRKASGPAAPALDLPEARIARLDELYRAFAERATLA